MRVAADGEEGLRRFRAEPPDLVVCDLYMPEREGMETIWELRRLDPAARVIALSGDEGLLRAAELLGLDPAQCLAVEDSPTGAAAADAAGCTVLVVPSLTTVPGSPRRVFRSTLEGLTVADLRGLHAAGER